MPRPGIDSLAVSAVEARDRLLQAYDERVTIEQTFSTRTEPIPGIRAPVL